jgi:alkaline phosphatase
MSSVNVNISVNNLPQLDRHQNDIHKNPIVNQDQNAKIANNEIAQRMNMPVEVDHSEGQVIDPKKKQIEEERKKNQKRARRDDQEKKKKHNSGGNGGLIVDVEA